jgi:predicted protein tyrosine phosphatase
MDDSVIKLFVVSKWEVEDIRDFDRNTLVISITSPGSKEANITGESVFRFQFHDVMAVHTVRDQIIRPLDREIAKAIAEVAMNHRDKKTWVIHCEAGVSRSPGVAIGLSRYLRFTTPRERLKSLFPSYNRYVVKMIEDAMEEKINKGG